MTATELRLRMLEDIHSFHSSAASILEAGQAAVDAEVASKGGAAGAAGGGSSAAALKK